MSDETFDELVRNACFAADSAFLNSPGMPGAVRTRRQIIAALQLLIGNGLISVTPREQWPEFISLDPPYPLPLEGR